MLKTRCFDALERIKTGFSDGGAWGSIYPDLCLRDGLHQGPCAKEAAPLGTASPLGNR